MSLHPAHPVPSTTTLGFSLGLVGPRPGGAWLCLFASVLKCVRDEAKSGNGCVFLSEDLMDETLVKFLNQAIVRFEIFLSISDFVLRLVCKMLGGPSRSLTRFLSSLLRFRVSCSRKQLEPVTLFESQSALVHLSLPFLSATSLVSFCFQINIA